MARWGLATPWSRAPLRLRRHPGVALAVAAAALLVALPASASALFLSSASTATLQQLVDSSCRWETGGHLEAGLPLRPVPDDPDAAWGGRTCSNGASRRPAPRHSVPRT